MADLGTLVIRDAALADLAPPGRTGDALSFNSLWLYLGVALGPIIGQAWLGSGGFTLAWLGAAGLTLPAATLPRASGDAANGGDRGRTS